ncbi:MAG: hypothetical protein HKL80_11625 [Acidimicrobiales bacterium]|nr:hypothetical protein [Acidimicrobiales bacterium]
MAMTQPDKVRQRREPARQKPSRTPPLRVVRQTELVRRAARKRVRRTLVFAGFLAAMAIFGTIAARGVLAERQLELDKLSTQLSSAQAEHQKLDSKLANLESPSRIVNSAENNLGMTTPSNVTYIHPANSNVSASTTTSPNK